ncbi:MAG TPA: cupin domain-containing protein [Stellaceae bacterium]|nr:cupin domain-containing protein [Stellaceae bacterium]
MIESRRSLLGHAAIGAGSLIGLSKLAMADAPAFAAKPGDGGAAFGAVQLPPGDPVVHHDADEVQAMDSFTYSLDGSKPKVTSGGWAKEATVERFKISKGIAGVHMFLDPGASRELHWHAIAAEWAFVIEGQCQTMVIDPTGQREVNNFGPGDLWYFPKGHGHSIQTIGDKPCHFILSFDNGAFSEHGTFSITDWVSLTPPDMLAANFGVPKEVFASFPKGETYIMAGPVLPPQQAKDAPWPKDSTHKFSLMTEKSALTEFEGGSIRLATVNEFPISKGMSGGIMTLKPGAIRELHWHPNANEWHYYLKGEGEVALFGSGGRGKIAKVKPGEVAYIPAGFGHAVRNTGKEDMQFVLTFDAGQFQEISLTDWMAASPGYLLANNFGQPESAFAQFPTRSKRIRPAV